MLSAVISSIQNFLKPSSSSSSSNNNMASKTIINLVEKLIEENFVMVFSKSYCPYCVSAKRLLTQKHVKFHAIELDQRQDGAEIQKYLIQKTGHRTVPNIFINKKHIGGCSDLEELEEEGKLDMLLDQRGSESSL